ncbi:MAG: bifunctional folylpolyglutamate synthase/dihydrofolate synthase [Thermoplasmatota archaeon]
MWTYEEALGWLYGRQGKGIKLGLENMQRMLDSLGNPERIPAVHVGGTNGKGSISHLLANALQNSGHKVGLYTSPHLTRFSERVKVNGIEISRGDVAELLWALKPLAQQQDREEAGPTFFELVTLLALLHFRNQGCDYVVLEVGLGGRLDCTNICTPAVSVISNVAMDHTEFLGDTIPEIALEKAGIMRQSVPCITGAEGEALHYLKLMSHERGTPMGILGQDSHVLPDLNGFKLAHPSGEAHYELALAGEHQIRNGALAVMAADALRVHGHHIPVAAVQDALRTTLHPGRLETVNYKGTPVLLDGAHNEAGAEALRRHLAHLDWHGFHLITGFNADKNWQAMLSQWAPLAVQTWGVPLRSGRSLDPEAMRPLVEGGGLPFATATVEEALAGAVAAGAERIVVAGSLFLVGETRARILGEPLEEIQGNQ